MKIREKEKYLLRLLVVSTVGRKKKGNNRIHFNSNHRTEINLLPIIMGYCLFLFDALKFFFGMRQHGLNQTLIFSM